MATGNVTNHATTEQPQAVYTIHTDVETAWRRRLCNIQLIPGAFSDRQKALATLATVRKTNPRAFIKTQTIRTAA